ncbi:MAG: radical SAM protein [Fibrobacteres bacterium]|nr:radical SAM protein [Fibrobacterota bacterium]
MDYIKAKTIVASKKYPEQWFGCDFNMNIYRGCCHGCIYCDSRSECYQISNFDKVVAKENAIELIERELKGKRRTGVIATGSMSDPYNPYEKKYQLTRKALEQVDRFGFGIHIITKSNLVARDIDILASIRNHSPASVGITITASDDELSKKIEPGAPLSSERFAAIKKLTDRNIYSGIMLIPLLPGITDTADNILSIVRQAAVSGAKFIYPMFGVTIRTGQREYLYRGLDKWFPGLREHYTNTFGDEYECSSENANTLSRLFKAECKKLKIDFEMSKIIYAIRDNVKIKQTSLF